MQTSPDEALTHLVYYSRAVDISGRPEADVMSDVLAVAVPRNQGLGVTGALLSCGGWFVQMLEGSKSATNLVFSSISDDRRHSAVTVISAGPVEERRFERWSMCGRTLSPLDRCVVDVLEGQKAFDPQRLSPTAAIQLLRRVSRLTRDRDFPGSLILDS